jgi:DNA-binding transcriptional MerR regulator
VPKYLTTEELAERFRTAPSTCRYWRMQGYGPTGVRVGRRTLYDLAEVERWEAEQLEKAKA